MEKNMNQDYERLTCGKCGVEMEEKSIELQYLKYNFTHTVPACPICGQVYLSEELVTGKMREVEKNFEEK